MDNVLRNFAEYLAPLEKTMRAEVPHQSGAIGKFTAAQYNEFYIVEYHNLDPAGSYISSEGGGIFLDPEGLRFNKDTFPPTTGACYLPLLTIVTEETQGYEFIELTRTGAQRFFEEERNLYEYLDILIRQLQDKDPAPYLPSFGVLQKDKRRCYSIGSELGVGEMKEYYDKEKPPQSESLVLCFGTGANPYYDQVLENIVSISEPDDWEYVWDFICDECSPKITPYGAMSNCWRTSKEETKSEETKETKEANNN